MKKKRKTDRLDENEDEARALVEARQKAEADIREMQRNHKSDMGAIRRRLAQAKLEEEMLEHELEMQVEERNKLKEERSSLARKYKVIFLFGFGFFCLSSFEILKRSLFLLPYRLFQHL